MPRKFVMGDIHGAYRALVQCFQRSHFDFRQDILICIGDACDGWPETKQVIDELLKVKNLVFIMGNHDQWAMKWFVSGMKSLGWYEQGGKATMESYDDGVPESHIGFYQAAKYYYQDNNRLFVHGGFDIDRPLDAQDEYTFVWDRELVSRARLNAQFGNVTKLTTFDEIYVGHTPTILFGSTLPIKASEVWMVDTGAGWPGGVLTLMDINTKDIFQSEAVDQLYPGFKGRG